MTRNFLSYVISWRTVCFLRICTSFIHEGTCNELHHGEGKSHFLLTYCRKGSHNTSTNLTTKKNKGTSPSTSKFMITDEREESLREVAALGNIKAVSHYIHAGVSVNAANKMNNWTPLHWATHRGHAPTIQILLSNGANPLLLTNKQQTAADLAKTDEIRALFPQEAFSTAHPEAELPIVPTYLKEPDLDKSWNLPDDFAEQRIRRILEHQKLLPKDEAPKSSTPVQTSPSAPSVELSLKEKEILVYFAKRTDENLLGAVFIDSQSTIEDVIKQIDDELDNVPSQFTISRHNGQLAIPISKKQWSKQALVHFRDEKDAIIVVPTN